VPGGLCQQVLRTRQCLASRHGNGIAVLIWDPRYVNWDDAQPASTAAAAARLPPTIISRYQSVRGPVLDPADPTRQCSTGPRTYRVQTDTHTFRHRRSRSRTQSCYNVVYTIILTVSVYKTTIDVIREISRVGEVAKGGEVRGLEWEGKRPLVCSELASIWTDNKLTDHATGLGYFCTLTSCWFTPGCLLAIYALNNFLLYSNDFKSSDFNLSWRHWLWPLTYTNCVTVYDTTVYVYMLQKWCVAKTAN